MSGKNRTSTEKIGPLVHLDMSEKCGIGLNLLTWISDSSPFHGKNRPVFRTYVRKWDCVLMLFDAIHVYMWCCLSICVSKSISRGLYQYISSYWHHTFSDLPLKFTGWAIIEELSIHRQSAHFWSVVGRKCVMNIVVLIYCHDMRSGLQ